MHCSVLYYSVLHFDIMRHYVMYESLLRVLALCAMAFCAASFNDILSSIIYLPTGLFSHCLIFLYYFVLSDGMRDLSVCRGRRESN